MAKRIKKCPFCGGKAKVEASSYFFGNGESMKQVYCFDCGCCTGYQTEERVIEIWNKRVNPK